MKCPYCRREITGVSKIQELLVFSVLEFGVTVEEMCGESRSPVLVAARRTFSQLARTAGYSLNQIGRVIHRHHTSVVNYVGKGSAR